jgi:hypothetical protein
MLEVRHDNPVAQGIYTRRGFLTYDTVDEMSVAPGRWPVVTAAMPEGVRCLRLGDGPALLRLAQASVPDAVQRCSPLRASDWSRGPGDAWRGAWRLLLRGEERLEVVASEGGELAAHGSAQVRLLGGQHTLRLLVRPGARGRWERPIADALLARMRQAPRQRIRSQVSLTHPEAGQALRNLGFVVHRTLDEMCLRLDTAAVR